jgi:hypothetical protein
MSKSKKESMLYKATYTAVQGGKTNVTQVSKDNKTKTIQSGTINVVGTGLASGITFSEVDDGVYTVKKLDKLVNPTGKDVSMDDVVRNVLKSDDPTQMLLNSAVTLPIDTTSVKNTKKLLATYLRGIYEASKGGEVKEIKVVGVASPEMSIMKDEGLKHEFNKMLAKSRGDAVKSMLQNLITKGKISFQYVDNEGKQQTQTITLDDVLSEAQISDKQAKEQLMTVVDKMVSEGEVLEQRKDIPDPSVERGAIIKVSYGSETEEEQPKEQPVNTQIAKIALSLVKPTLTPEKRVNWGVGFQRGRFGYEAYMTNFYNMVASELPKVVHNAGASISNAVAMTPEIQLNRAKELYENIVKDEELSNFIRSATQQTLSPMDEAKIRALQARTAKDIIQIKALQQKLLESKGNAKSKMSEPEFKIYATAVNQFNKNLETRLRNLGVKAVEDKNGILAIVDINTGNREGILKAIEDLENKKNSINEYIRMYVKDLNSPVAKQIKEDIEANIDYLISNLKYRLNSPEASVEQKTAGGGK